MSSMDDDFQELRRIHAALSGTASADELRWKARALKAEARALEAEARTLEVEARVKELEDALPERI